MADKISRPNSEILPKDTSVQKSLHLGQWIIPPKAVQVVKRVIKIGIILGLLGWAGWSLQNFLQLRGIVSVLDSPINLAFFWVALFLVGWMLSVAIRRKGLYRVFIGILLLGCVWGLDWWAPRPQQTPSPTPSPISFRLGCDLNPLPIHIPAASTIHVIRVHPAILTVNTGFQVGVFENVSSSSDKALDWPMKQNGRWMTQAEWHKAQGAIGMPPNPWAFACTLTSYSSSTLEEIVTSLLVDTPDKKRHSYPVSFDPLMAGHTFSFYVVNVCSSGVIPTLVQWDDFARVQVLGEPQARRVPLRYEKNNWISQLVGPFGPSSFIWNDLHNCQWDKN